MRKENGSGRVIILALWILAELLCFVAQKLQRSALGEAGRDGHQLLQGMEHVRRSSHALFITSSFHWNQLEEVVSLV